MSNTYSLSLYIYSTTEGGADRCVIISAAQIMIKLLLKCMELWINTLFPVETYWHWVKKCHQTADHELFTILANPSAVMRHWRCCDEVQDGLISSALSFSTMENDSRVWAAHHTAGLVSIRCSVIYYDWLYMNTYTHTECVREIKVEMNTSPLCFHRLIDWSQFMCWCKRKRQTLFWCLSEKSDSIKIWLSPAKNIDRSRFKENWWG